MYSCTMPVPEPGGGGGWGHVPPPEEAVSVLKKIAHYMILRIYTVMVLGGLVEVWRGLGVSMDRTTFK